MCCIPVKNLLFRLKTAMKLVASTIDLIQLKADDKNSDEKIEVKFFRIPSKLWAFKMIVKFLVYRTLVLQIFQKIHFLINWKSCSEIICLLAILMGRIWVSQESLHRYSFIFINCMKEFIDDTKKHSVKNWICGRNSV